ncbi:MAG: ABC transporter ATP-binding protein [Mollicutes bacterium]|nr:ABC transporter ATP-binding protein [Mollicutes bacterium]
MKKQLIEILKKNKKIIIIEAIMCIILRVILLINPMFYSNAVNNISNSNFKNAIIILIAYLGSVSLYKIIEYIRHNTFYNVYNSIYKGCTEIGIKSTYNNSNFSLSRFNISQYINIMNTDIDTISSFFANSIYRIVQLAEFIFIYYYFFKTDLLIFSITIITSIIVFLFITIFGNKIQIFNTTRKEDFDKKTGSINNYFVGISDIKGFNIGKRLNKDINKSADKYTASNAKYNVLYNTINIIAVYVFQLLRLFVFIYGVYQISKGNMKLGVILIIYDYYQKIIDNFSLVSTLNLEYKNLGVSLERFNKLFEYAHEEEKNDDENHKNLKGNIEFKNILYGYRHDPILSNFSVKYKTNNIYGITGKTGSGKTGVFDLLMKMNSPIEGVITIDGINIDLINDYTYYNLVSVVKQNPFFFEDSIKNNLVLAGNDFDDIVAVCKEIGFHDRIMGLEKGYDTIISNESNIFSTPEKNLLGIIRVILKDTKIYMFDEVIETLDNDCLKKVMKALQKRKKNHTIFIITRNKRILRQVDEITLLDEGEVVDVGTHTDLTENSDLYSEI